MFRWFVSIFIRYSERRIAKENRNANARCLFAVLFFPLNFHIETILMCILCPLFENTFSISPMFLLWDLFIHFWLAIWQCRIGPFPSPVCTCVCVCLFFVCLLFHCRHCQYFTFINESQFGFKYVAIYVWTFNDRMLGFNVFLFCVHLTEYFDTI